MYPRTERLLTWLAFLIAIAMVLIGVLELDKRSEETPVAAPSPTAQPTAAATEPPTPTEPPTAAPSERPPSATAPPAAAPPAQGVSEPSPPAPGMTPMPHTGADPTPGGLLVLAGVALIAVIARHTEARKGARSSTG